MTASPARTPRTPLLIAGAMVGATAIGAAMLAAAPWSDPAPAHPAAAPVTVALLDGPGPEAFLPGRPFDSLVRERPTTIRTGATGARHRFLAARAADTGRVCLFAVPRVAGAARAGACNDAAVLSHVGVLALIRAADGIRPRVADIALLVPDGTTRVRIGTRTVTVTRNMATTSLPLGDLPGTVTLEGPAAQGVHSRGPRDWAHGTRDGAPTVTVPLSYGTAVSPRRVDLHELRLVAPARAAGGSVIELRIQDPDGLLGRDVVYGAGADLTRDGAVTPVHLLRSPAPGQATLPAPRRSAFPGPRVGAGFQGSLPTPVRLPAVAPGRYVISKGVISNDPVGEASLTLTAEIEITAP